MSVPPPTALYRPSETFQRYSRLSFWLKTAYVARVVIDVTTPLESGATLMNVTGSIPDAKSATCRSGSAALVIVPPCAVMNNGPTWGEDANDRSTPFLSHDTANK